MRKIRKKLIAVGTAIFIALGTVGNVMAEGKRTVERFKIWKVKFSEKVDITSINQKVYVTSESGEKIYLDGAHGAQMEEVFFLPPEKGYRGDYTLTVEKGIKSISGKTLHSGTNVEFSTSSQVQPEESYDPVTVNLVQYDFQDNIVTVSSGYMVDRLIIGKIDIMENTSKIKIAYADGETENVREIVNWDGKKDLFTMKYMKTGFVNIRSNNSSHMNWLSKKLGINDIDEIKHALMEKEELTIGEIKGKLYSQGSMRGVEERVNKYYSQESLSNGQVMVDKIYLSRIKGQKKINTYISLDEANSRLLLSAYDSNLQDKEKIKNWIARINNYVKGNYPDYLVEGKLMLTLGNEDIINYFSLDDVYFDSSTKKYYTKKPVLMHINVNSKDYFIER